MPEQLSPNFPEKVDRHMIYGRDGYPLVNVFP